MIIILNKFFILIGTAFLSIVSFFENISFEGLNIREESGNNEITEAIFSKLDFENNTQKRTKDDNILDKIHERLMQILFKKSSVKYVIGFSIAILIILPIELAAMFLTLTAMAYIFTAYYPKIKRQNNYSDLNQELPYALRHMGIELKSGKGLHDTLLTIKESDYGTFSKEITRVLEEVKFGKSTEDSLLEMSKRVKSEGLTRAIQQIVGTLRVGGNLANSLEIIAKDMSFEMQIKLKEYSQRLNSFILIYTFIAILAPVISLIMLMAGSTVMGDIISSSLVFLIYTLFFPMVIIFMGVFIKKLEPNV